MHRILTRELVKNLSLQRNVLLFAVAFAVRWIYLHQSLDFPNFHTPLIDAMQHHELAIRFLSGGGIDDRFFSRPLVYPLFLAGLYALGDNSLFFAKLIQAGLGALTCLLTFHLGRRIFDERVAWLAAVLVIFCGPLIFWEQELVAAGLASFASVALLHLLLSADEKQTYLRFFSVGAMGGIALATRPSFLFFVVGAGLWLLVRVFRNSRSGMGAWGPGAAFLIGLLVILGPIGMSSQRSLGHFSFLPSTGALNAYIGNNPDSCDTLTLRPGEHFSDLMLEPLRAGAKTSKEQSQYFREKVFAYAVQEPSSFLSGLAHKTLQVANGREVPRNLDIYIFRSGSPLLRGLVWKWGWFGFPWGFLFPLSCLGLFLCWSRVPMPIRLFVFFYPATLVLVFVSGRYRVPLYPVLSILSAVGIAELVKFVRASNFRAAGLASAGVILVAFLTHLNPPSCEEKVNYLAEMHVFLGTAEYKKGDMPAARAHYQDALRVNPTNVRAHYELGKSLLNPPLDTAAAIEHLLAAMSQGEDTYVRFQLGEAYFRGGEFEKALENFDLTIRALPDYIPAHYERAGVLYNQRRLQDAIAALEELLKVAYAGWAGEHWKGKVAEAENRLLQLYALRRELGEGVDD